MFFLFPILTLLACLRAAPFPPQSTADETTTRDDHGGGPNERKRRELLRISDQLRQGYNPYFGSHWIQRLEEQRAKRPDDAPPDTIYANDRPLAEWYLREGRVDEAIQTLTSVMEVASKDPGAGGMFTISLARDLAVAYLRRAEQANCICQRGGESCIFPLSEAAEHTKPAGAEAARDLLERALDAAPGDLQCVWLLNIAHMALGTYPEGVPPLYRIDPARLQSEYDLGRFTDMASAVGLEGRDCAGGAVMDDFDADGDLDLMLSSLEPASPMRYYRNDGAGSFQDVSEETGVDCQLGALNFVQGDLDGDGLLDLYVPRGAWLGREGEVPHSLLRQRPDGTFLDVTRRSGIEAAAPSQVAALADVDADGDLDLFVGCESMRSRTGSSYPSLLYRNDGRLRFEEVGAAAGVQNLASCKGAAFGDYDRDGFPDLYVSNIDGPNRLYRNQGDGTFVDVAEEMGVAEPIFSFATWWFDVNNDGWLDLLVTSYYGRDRPIHVAAYYKNGANGTDATRVYLNLQGKGFEDVSRAMSIDRPFFAMGANYGDFDNDGFPDLYFGTGDPDFGSLWPNVAFRNDRGQRFQDVTTSAGLGHLQKGHGIAFGDLDRDGDQDLLVQLGGAFRDDAFFNCLLRNPGHGHHWLTVQLTGVRSNRFGVGAQIRARIEEPAGERDVYVHVGSGGSFGGNSLQAEMGLGEATRIVELEVLWPRPGEDARERFAGVPLDRVVSLVEGTGQSKVIETTPIEF